MGAVELQAIRGGGVEGGGARVGCDGMKVAVEDLVRSLFADFSVEPERERGCRGGCRVMTLKRTRSLYTLGPTHSDTPRLCSDRGMAPLQREQPDSWVAEKTTWSYKTFKAGHKTVKLRGVITQNLGEELWVVTFEQGPGQGEGECKTQDLTIVEPGEQERDARSMASAGMSGRVQ